MSRRTTDKSNLRSLSRRSCQLHTQYTAYIYVVCIDQKRKVDPFTADPVNALHFAVLERQSARMSKIKNGGLDQYGAEPLEQQQFGTVGVEWVKQGASPFRLQFFIRCTHNIGCESCVLTPNSVSCRAHSRLR